MKQPKTSVYLTTVQRELLRRAALLVLAGEWPWEPEKQGERKALEKAIEELRP